MRAQWGQFRVPLVSRMGPFLSAEYREETEQESRRLPNDLFSEKTIRECLRMGMILGGRYFGLEDHQITPDFAALERLLTQRYRFKMDDVEHEPIFDGCDDV